MSIFKKITILFSISLSLMIIIGYQMDSINTKRVEALITQKYLQDAKEIFVLLATSNPQNIQKQVEELDLKTVDIKLTKDAKTIVKQTHSFGEMKVLKTAAHSEYLLFINYMDESIVLIDDKLQKSFKEQWLLNILVVFDIVVLIAIFFIILKILSPLKELIKSMKSFAKGQYTQVEVKSYDEIGEAASTYNMMAQNIKNLLSSREEFLRDIGHELKTPISKGMFASEALADSDPKNIIKNLF